MVKVTVGGVVVAESNETKIVEGNHYFPPDSVKSEHFADSNTHTTCPWKGIASYYNFGNEGNVVKDVAWYYPETKEKANEIKNYVAFYKNKVSIEE